MVRVLLGSAILIAMSATLIASGLADEPDPAGSSGTPPPPDINRHPLSCDARAVIYPTASRSLSYLAFSSCIGHTDDKDITVKILWQSYRGSLDIERVVETETDSCLGCAYLQIYGEMDRLAAGNYSIRSTHTFTAHGDSFSGTRYYCCAEIR